MSSNRKAAIVTGSASGIGRAIALRLASDGFNLALHDLPSSANQLEEVAERVRSQGGKAIIITGDVTKESEVDALVEAAVNELGILWVMVANAGIGQPVVSVANISLELWNKVLSVNLTGVFLCYRAAARQLLKQGTGGRIIGACSGYGKKAAPDFSAYCASKFGIRGLTQSLAAELGQHGITVNAYAPGFVQTPLLEKLAEWAADSDVKRVGIPEDITGIVSYIASEQSSFMTGGQIICL
ncbi:hypothetical protein M422DRAFT_58243 [Sphaerobolus stellatus SS14]|nr:hypothetical protein M422DRAFT_58243 [Sphaerobolus stellatus SS14]